MGVSALDAFRHECAEILAPFTSVERHELTAVLEETEQALLEECEGLEDERSGCVQARSACETFNSPCDTTSLRPAVCTCLGP